MRKKLCLFVVIALTFLLTGCMTKEPISYEVFVSSLNEKAYQVIESDTLTKIEGITGAYTAYNENQTIVIEYILFGANEYSSSYFNTYKSSLESYNPGSYASITGQNYEKYTCTASGSYYYVIRVDNTVIVAKSDSSNKEEIKSIMEDFGY